MLPTHIESRSTAVFEPGPGPDGSQDPAVVILRPTEIIMVPPPAALAKAIETLVNDGAVTTVGEVWEFIGEEFPQLNYVVVLVNDIPPVFTANGRMVVISVGISCPGQYLELA